MITSLPNSPEPSNSTRNAVGEPGVPSLASKGSNAAAGDAFGEKGVVAMRILETGTMNDGADSDSSRYKHSTPAA